MRGARSEEAGDDRAAPPVSHTREWQRNRAPEKRSSGAHTPAPRGGIWAVRGNFFSGPKYRQAAQLDAFLFSFIFFFLFSSFLGLNLNLNFEVKLVLH